MKEKNWEALRIGEMMLKAGYSQTFRVVEWGDLLLVETGVQSVEADELLVGA